MPDNFETLERSLLGGVHGGQNPRLFAAMEKAWELGLTINSIHTGNHAVHSRHWRGRAIDIGGSAAQLSKFVQWARRTNYHELIYKNLFLKDGRRRRGIGGHGHHVHYSV